MTQLLNLDGGISAPFEIHQASADTTDATQTTLATIAVAEDEIVMVWAWCQTIQDDGSQGYSAIKAGSYRRDAGGDVTLIGSVADIFEAEDSGGAPDFTFTADTTAQTVDLDWTGEAATNYAVKLTYAFMRQGTA